MTLRTRLVAYSSLLAALAILYAVGIVTSPARRRAKVEPLLDGLRAELVTQFDVSDPGRQISIHRDADSWYIERDGERYPARSDRVDILFEELERARLVRLVSRDAARHDSFGVGNDATRLRIGATLGGVGGVLIWGNAAAEPGLTYVRRADDDSIYTSDGRITFYLSQPDAYWGYLRVFPESLLASEIVSLHVSGLVPDDAAQREVHYTLVNHGSEDAAWVLESDETELEFVSVNRLLRDVADLVGKDFAVGFQGGLELANPVVVLEIETSRGQHYSAEVFAADDGYVLVPGGPDLPGLPFGGLGYVIDSAVLRRITPDSETFLPIGE